MPVPRRQRQLLDVAASIVEDGPGSDSFGALARAVNEACGGDLTAYHGGLNPQDGSIRSDGYSIQTDSIPWAELRKEFCAYHPLAQIAPAPGLTPLRVSDLVSDRVWRKNPCYPSAHRELNGACRHLSIPTPSTDGLADGFIVARAGSDFSDGDLDFVRRMCRVLYIATAQVDVLGEPTAERKPPRKLGPLTPRETAVLSLARDGMTNEASSRRLAISIHTVNKHLENAYRKLGANGRISAIKIATDNDMFG